MKVTKDQVFKLCEEIHRLKRMGDHHITSQDWHQGTIASCALANSVMNNMTNVVTDHAMDTRTQVALSILLNILTHEQSRPTFMLDKIDGLARRAVLLADAMLNQLDKSDGDKITSEDSRKYWQVRNSELKRRVAELEARCKRLEQLGAELRECAGYLGWTSSDASNCITRAERACEAWDKEAKP